jgi:glycosyltransferase involved in cell wall biosynthesis
MHPEVARKAAEQAADLYIGHYPPGLAAAAYAADQHGAMLGYDAEDFHVGQQPDNEPRIARIDYIERQHLEACAHVTAASAGIADAVADRYDIERPLVVDNVFPWAERDTLDGETKDRRGNALSLYWYSQTIGLNRGLQDAIRAAGLLDEPVQLHIRGALRESVRDVLMTTAERSGMTNSVYFHPKVPPDELLSRAVEHDIGLALEQGHTPARTVCATNKLFFYPMAGLAVAATDVLGQRHLLKDRSAFSGMCEPGNAEALAQILRRWTDPVALEEAKSEALDMARTRWNWETEKEKLVDAIDELF